MCSSFHQLTFGSQAEKRLLTVMYSKLTIWQLFSLKMTTLFIQDNFKCHFVNLLCSKVESTQYKKVAAKCFAIHVSKFEILRTTWRNKTKSIKILDLLMKNWKLKFWCSFLRFFMWFAKFEISICEKQSIWRKLLVLSWLYTTAFLFSSCVISRNPRVYWSKLFHM